MEKQICFLMLNICIISLFLNIETASASPQIVETIGNIVQGNSFEVAGSSFGVKNPASPLLWDDGSGGVSGISPSKVANSASQQGYSEYQPSLSRESDIPDDFITKYREIPYRNVDGPHSRTTKYITGGHYEDNDANHGGRDVSITIPDSENGTGSDRWFAIWYEKRDPLWPDCGAAPNDKMTVIQAGTVSYSNNPYPNQYFYMNYNPFPCNKVAAIRIISHNQSPVTNSTDDVFPDNNPPWDWNMAGTSAAPFTRNIQINNPFVKWVHQEQRTSNDQGFLQFLVDNITAWHGTNLPNWMTSGGLNWERKPASFTIGGYFRSGFVDGDPANAGYQDNNAFRYFSDIYVDNTFSRVMLANNPNYDLATIIEPQIPIAWADNRITFKANLGKLPDFGTAYLFVFDSDNEKNSIGFPITLGGADTDAPLAPNGFSAI